MSESPGHDTVTIRGPTFSVVIRTYGRPEHLRNCLRSLESQTERPTEVIVVQAGIVHQSREPLDRIGLITLQQQGRGISNAANEGIARASGDVIAFIDDDASASANWIEALRRRYVAEPSIAGAGGLVIDSRTNEIWFDRGIIDVFGECCLVPRTQTQRARLHHPVFPVLLGCNMSFRKETLQELGGFDEFYRFQHEESDLCVRIQQTGHRIAFEPNAVVWHHYAPGPTRRLWFYNDARSRIYFSLANFARELPLHRLVPRTLVRLVGLGMYAAFQAIRLSKRTPLALGQFLQTVAGTSIGFVYGVRVRMVGARARKLLNCRSFPR